MEDFIRQCLVAAQLGDKANGTNAPLAGNRVVEVNFFAVIKFIFTTLEKE